MTARAPRKGVLCMGSCVACCTAALAAACCTTTRCCAAAPHTQLPHEPAGLMPAAAGLTASQHRSVDVKVCCCTAAPRPVLPHGARHQLLPPPLRPFVIGVQGAVHCRLHVLRLAPTARHQEHNQQQQESVVSAVSAGAKDVLSGPHHIQHAAGQMLLHPTANRADRARYDTTH
jgi:hypothetical protein